MGKIGSVAYLGGTFDLLHPGHIELFRWIKQNFDRLVVSVNRSEFVARFKHPPVQSLGERMAMLHACRYVDWVLVNGFDEDSRPAVLISGASHIVCGSDWSEREVFLRQMGMSEEFLDEYGIELVVAPLPRTRSSSELKQRVKAQ